MNGLHLLALALTCGAVVVAIGALTARSLFALCMYVAAAAALAAGAALALGAGDAGLGLALFAAAWAPVLLLAAMLLSARTVKPTRRGAPWFSLVAACLAGAGVFFAVPDLGPAPIFAAPPGGGLGMWLAPALLAAAAACVGLLGYGERGALQHPGDDAP
jgi:hypothetical protein